MLLSPRSEIPVLNGFRALAILLIVVYHMGLKTSWYPHRLIEDGGWVGVQLFFVLSGFLLSLPYLHSGLTDSAIPSAINFYRKRMLRVFPLYFFSLAVYLVYGYFQQSLPSVPHILLHFVFLHNLLSEISPVYGPYWSLGVEIQVYLLFPVIGFVVYKALVKYGIVWLYVCIGCLILIPLLFRIYVTVKYHGFPEEKEYLRLIYMHPLSHLDAFGWGILGAFMYSIKYPQQIPQRIGLILFFCAVLSIIGLLHFTVINGGWKISHDLYAPGYFYSLLNGSWFLMIVGGLALEKQVIGKLLSGRLLKFIATISFSIYIWHGLIFDAVRFVLRYLVIDDQLYRNAFLLVVSSLLIAGISTLSYYVIERPFVKRRVSAEC